MNSPTTTNSPAIEKPFSLLSGETNSPTVASPAELSTLTESVMSGKFVQKETNSPPKELEGKFDKEVIFKPTTSGKPPKPVTVSIHGFDISIQPSPMKSKKSVVSNNSIVTTTTSSSSVDASTNTDDLLNVELSDVSQRMKENKEYIRAKREEKEKIGQMIQEKWEENETLLIELVHILEIEESRVKNIEKERDDIVVQLSHERNAKEELLRKFGGAFETMTSFHQSLQTMGGEKM